MLRYLTASAVQVTDVILMYCHQQNSSLYFTSNLLREVPDKSKVYTV